VVTLTHFLNLMALITPASAELLSLVNTASQKVMAIQKRLQVETATFSFELLETFAILLSVSGK